MNLLHQIISSYMTIQAVLTLVRAMPTAQLTGGLSGSPVHSIVNTAPQKPSAEEAIKYSNGLLTQHMAASSAVKSTNEKILPSPAGIEKKSHRSIINMAKGRRRKRTLCELLVSVIGLAISVYGSCQGLAGAPHTCGCSAAASGLLYLLLLLLLFY